MQDQTGEQKPNPYNAKKSWHTQVEAPFVDANSLFNPTPVPEDKDAEGPTEQVATQDVDTVEWKKRYDDLKRHYDVKVNEHKQETTQLKSERDAAVPKYTPPKNEEEMAAFVRENPDIAAVVETIAHNQTVPLQEKIDKLTASDADYRAREANTILKGRHTDFDTIKSDPKFHAWAEGQPKVIQDWIYENPYDGELASRAIDLYKQDMGMVPPVSEGNEPPLTSVAEKDAADVASLVPTRSTAPETAEKKVWTAEEIGKLSTTEYDKVEADIDKAMLEGRVIPRRRN